MMEEANANREEWSAGMVVSRADGWCVADDLLFLRNEKRQRGCRRVPRGGGLVAASSAGRRRRVYEEEDEMGHDSARYMCSSFAYSVMFVRWITASGGALFGD